jgi:hypothetical protein
MLRMMTAMKSNGKLAILRKLLFGQNHRLSINRPTKLGKEKSSSDGHCQCQKEMDDPLLACHKF